MANSGRTVDRVFLRLFPFLVLALSGCTSLPPIEERVPTKPELVRKQIDMLIDEENWELASIALGRAADQRVFDNDELTQYVERIVGPYRDAGNRAIERENYGRALVVQNNLLHILARAGRQAEKVLTHDRLDLVALHLESLLDEEQWIPALEQFRRYHDAAFADSVLLADHDRLLERLAEAAQKVNHQDVVRQIASYRGNEPTEPNAAETSDMLKGVVTVWVNRGIKIRNGVGVPDQVVGSGFFVDPRGYLLTNYHVIRSEVDPEYEGYSRLYVKMSEDQDRRIPARVVGYDRVFDLALVKVEIDPEYVFSIGTKRSLNPGEPVYALGSPGGLQSSVTSGIVSSGGRRFLQMGEAVQVDTAINPGSSGGPLIVPSGEVAGIVFAGIEQFEGVNFAVPSYWIHKVLGGLFLREEPLHPWVGAAARKIDGELELVYVMPETPAELAGLQAGDRLVTLDGRNVESLPDIHAILLDHPVGTMVSATIQRENVDRTVSLVTVERPYSPAEAALDLQPIEDLFPVLYGMQVHPVASAPWGADYIVDRVYPGGIADESNLSELDPFALRDWFIDEDLRAAFIQIIIKKRKAGFIESGVQLGSYLETNLFF